MAYLSFELIEAAERLAPAPHGTKRLSPLEQEAVIVSLRDPLRSVRRIGRIERLGGLIFGGRHVTAFSDNRLEAIRRFAVSRRLERNAAHRRATADAEAAGLEPSVLEQIRLIVDAHVRRHPVRSINPLALLGLSGSVAGTYWLFGWINERTGDAYVSFMLMCIATVLVLPLLLPRSRLARR